MEKINPNEELLQKIKEKIKVEAPHSRTYARFLSYLKIGFIFTLVIVSVMTLSLFISDIVEKFQGVEFENLTFFQSIFGFAFGFLLVSMLATLAIFVIYRGTDWPFVKEKTGILLTSFLIVLLLSLATVFVSETETTKLGDFLNGMKDKIEEKLSLKKWLDGKNPDEVKSIQGRVTSVEKAGRDWIIIVTSDSETQELMLEHRFGEFFVGDKVKVKYEVDGTEKDVEKIERIEY